MTYTELSRERVVALARDWCGTPYRHQASLKGAGCDCLGLIRGIYRTLYGREPETPPPYSPDWAEVGRGETLVMAARRNLIERPAAAALPGDILIFRVRPSAPAKHTGIVLPRGCLVHAYAPRGVRQEPLSPWWRRRIAYAFAFPGLEDAPWATLS